MFGIGMKSSIERRCDQAKKNAIFALLSLLTYDAFEVHFSYESVSLKAPLRGESIGHRSQAQVDAVCSFQID